MKSRKILERERFSKIVSEAESYKDCIKKVSLTSCGGSYDLIKYWITHYNLSIDHFNSERQRLGKTHERIRANQIPLAEILVYDSNYNRGSLKKRLYSYGLKQRKCEKCGQDEIWYGEKISLILDHINGVNNDNRIEQRRKWR